MAEHTQARRVTLRLFSSGKINQEMLQPCAVNAVIAHPLKVSQHGSGVIRTEQFRLATVGRGEARRGIPFFGRVFAHVRPHLETKALWGDGFRIAAPVNPSQVRRIARTTEPALITAHYFALQRRCIHNGRVLAFDRKPRGNEQEEREPKRPLHGGPPFAVRGAQVIRSGSKSQDDKISV